MELAKGITHSNRLNIDTVLFPYRLSVISSNASQNGASKLLFRSVTIIPSAARSWRFAITDKALL